MRKASNKHELSNRLISSSNSLDVIKSKQYNTDIDETIHRECNKPLQSRFFVSSNNKTKFEWNYNSDRHYGVYRAVGNLWLCRDRNIHELSECEKEQIRLYNRLKREYELEQKLLNNKTVSETTVTKEDKLRARIQKQTYLLDPQKSNELYGISGNKWSYAVNYGKV